MPTNQAYETVFHELEQTVNALEAGDLPLEQALSHYERGMALAAQCNQLLQSAELRVQQIINGQLVSVE
ncbi:exodeoxyribonuclease VII small subunit [Herpetosiphon geysericola]|uniref:Exodeoxyribonuclease 7 small subunit n=1 Tax=Herpetosiphon geysericola TaxID=70996 RepID=A0A0P6XNJ7_9CHLR|nr:exodeoxyribonuclease VII small subunit [Herpetosiphon geysericola]KPL81357.1 exodeoxyribonuclease VII small subunit [Herpetosiphon geysericola]